MYNFKDVTDFGNLYMAYKKSRSGSGHKDAKLRFESSAMDGIYQIKRLLETHQYNVSPYNKFVIHDPKERVIESGSFKDQIVQHSLCDNVLLPLLKDEFILTNVAGQLGKGTLFGLDCLRDHMISAYDTYGYDCWIIKGDVRKYFYSIDHNLLKDIIRYHVSDPDVIWLCDKFIDSTDSPGLPLGNQITQIFGVLFLSGMDRFITGELGVKYYGRYTDDFYLIVSSKEYAISCLKSINEFVSTLNLELNGKTQIIPFKNGIKYCGFHTYITKSGKPIRKIYNSKKRANKKKYRKMAHLVKDVKMSMDDFLESYNSWKAHIQHGNCYKLGCEMDKYISQLIGDVKITLKQKK